MNGCGSSVTGCIAAALRKYKVPIQGLWETGWESLLKLPKYLLPVLRYEALSMNKYGLIPMLVGKTVQVKIFFDHVEFYHDHQPVDRYRRSYGRDEEL